MKDVEFKIPKKELLMILPDQRKKLFVDLVKRYPQMCQNMTLVYAYLNMGSKAQIGVAKDKKTPIMKDTPYDYVLIFRIEAPESEAGFFYGIDIPLIYSNRSLPGYRYCIRENKLQDFFLEATNEMARLPYVRFIEFIESMAELSHDPTSPDYWAAPQNAKKLLVNLSELTRLYVKRT